MKTLDELRHSYATPGSPPEPGPGIDPSVSERLTVLDSQAILTDSVRERQRILRGRLEDQCCPCCAERWESSPKGDCHRCPYVGCGLELPNADAERMRHDDLVSDMMSEKYITKMAAMKQCWFCAPGGRLDRLTVSEGGTVMFRCLACDRKLMLPEASLAALEP